MPGQSILRFIKRWRRYEQRGDWTSLPDEARGLYVLYRSRPPDVYEVVYIGVAGISMSGRAGIVGRLKRHHREKSKNWTHYSAFEVHDNVTREEIRELEAVLLEIFRNDPRIKLANQQTGSRQLVQLRKSKQWKAK